MLPIWLHCGPPTLHSHHTLLCRYNDPNSGTSSFSILLGDAPHLDMQYTIFGVLTKVQGSSGTGLWQHRCSSFPCMLSVFAHSQRYRHHPLR
jgi:cyclophilin family peptidyl-prolyl cis-trans isomerase